MPVNLAPIDVLILVMGSALLLKKVADMDRYQTFRTIAITTILGAVVVYFFLVTLSPLQPSDCFVSFDHP